MSSSLIAWISWLRRPGQQQHDGAIAAPGRAIAMYGADQLANLPDERWHDAPCLPRAATFGTHGTRSRRVSPVANMNRNIRRRFVAFLSRFCPRPGTADGRARKARTLLRPDTVQLAGFRSEKEDQKIPEELLAFGDRGPAQPPLQAQPIAIVSAQLLKPARWRQRFRLRRDDHTGGDKMINEPGEAGTSAATRVQRLRLGHRVLQFRQTRSIDVAGTKPAGCNLFPKQIDSISKMTD